MPTISTPQNGAQALRFFVPGIPKPQGSMKVFNGHVVHENAPALKAWRETVAWTAKAAGAKVWDTPISVEVNFHLPRGKTVKRKYPTVPPDCDKLLRAIFDALTGICYTDDARIIKVAATKTYDTTPGASIAISQIM